MTGVTIPGVGMTNFRSELPYSIVEMASLAATRALDDAGYRASEVTSLHVGTALADSLGLQAGLGNALTSSLGIEGVAADRVENTSATGASALHRGVAAIQSGQSDVALVVGAEKMSVGETANVTEAISRVTHEREYAQGLTLPSFGGLAAGVYLDRYDVPRETLATVAAKNHANAADNPVAQFRKTISVADALESPVIADPLRLYDCCPMTDGAAAVLLTRETMNDVQILSVGSATGTHAVAERPDPLEIESVREAGERTFDDAGMTPDDMDVVCIHDAFTILELLELEELGFYQPGTAWQAVMEGETRRDGRLPVNPGGGLKARGHPLGATGLSQIIELVWQLRGDLPPNRQVPNASTAFAINVAGFGNNSVCTILEA
ncbi:thiolase family protein [Haloferax sp. DFSO60]|uniref:thiolase family protein n=1 Tax=Haloferax sp. DFSO60 TaxID=3388652 RepID=UPI00397954E8